MADANAQAETNRDESRNLLGDTEKPRMSEDLEWPPDPDPEMQDNGGAFATKWAFMQVTFRCPLRGPLHLIALIYGFVPFALPVAVVVHWAITKHFMDVYCIGIMVFCFILNEFMLKPLCNQPRPKLTANIDTKTGKIKHGMPSGHVINSAAIMFWALSELIMSGPGFEANAKVTQVWLAMILLLTFPVPWARWHNSDHTWQQCCVSLCLGLVIGPVAFYLRHRYFPQQWQYWDDFLPVSSTALPSAGPMSL